MPPPSHKTVSGAAPVPDTVARPRSGNWRSSLSLRIYRTTGTRVENYESSYFAPFGRQSRPEKNKWNKTNCRSETGERRGINAKRETTRMRVCFMCGNAKEILKGAAEGSRINRAYLIVGGVRERWKGESTFAYQKGKSRDLLIFRSRHTVYGRTRRTPSFWRRKTTTIRIVLGELTGNLCHD